VVPSLGAGQQRYVFNHRFKLYDNGEFFDIEADLLEQKPTTAAQMNDLHFRVRDAFQEVLDNAPKDPPKLAKPGAKK